MKKIKVVDLGKIVTGKTPKTNISENYGGNIPFLTPTDDLKPMVCSNTINTLSEKGLKEVYNCLIPKNSVCVSCIGSDMGHVIMTSKPTVTNQQFNSIIPSEDFQPEYVYYLMILLGRMMKSKFGKSSTAVPIVSKSLFSSFDIFVDENIERQKIISNVLISIDQKISLNTRMNAELEAMAKQLYDYWFVQFDFPDENGNPYKSSGGKMVYNPTLKREIPAGWEVKGLGDVLTFSNGINYEKGIEGDKEYKIINVRNITSSSVYINKSELDTISLPSKQAGNYLIEENDIIIARSGTPGSTRLIDNPIDVIYCGFIIKGSPIDSAYKYYVTFFLKQLEGTQATKTGGSILQNVSQETLKSLNLVLPGKHLFTTFNEKIKALFTLLNKKQDENNELTHLRDSLLPMLMNGQVTVK